MEVDEGRSVVVRVVVRDVVIVVGGIIFVVYGVGIV